MSYTFHYRDRHGQAPTHVMLHATDVSNHVSYPVVTVGGHQTAVLYDSSNGAVYGPDHPLPCSISDLSVGILGTVSISHTALDAMSFSGDKLNVQTDGNVRVLNDLCVNVLGTVPVSNTVLSTMAFTDNRLRVHTGDISVNGTVSVAGQNYDGERLKVQVDDICVNVLGTVPVSNTVLDNMAFTDNRLRVHTGDLSVNLIGPVTVSGQNYDGQRLKVQVDDICVNVLGTVPVSNTVLDNMAFIDNRLRVHIGDLSVGVIGAVTVSGQSYEGDRLKVQIQGDDLSVNVLNTVTVSNSALSTLAFEGDRLKVWTGDLSVNGLKFNGDNLKVETTIPDLSVNIIGTVPVSHSALDTMAFSGGDRLKVQTGDISVNSLNFTGDRLKVESPFQTFTSIVDISGSTNITGGYTSATVDLTGYSRFSVGVIYGVNGLAHFNQIHVSNDGVNWYNLIHSRWDTGGANENTHMGVQYNASYVVGKFSIIKDGEGGRTIFDSMWRYMRVRLNSGNGFTGPVVATFGVNRLEIFLAT